MIADLNTILEDFALLDDWEDRYRYVIDLGRDLPPFPDSERTAANRVPGCVSQVWLKTQRSDGDDPVIRFEGDADAHIVRGLMAIMLALYSDRPASEIMRTDVEATFAQLGLNQHLSPQRSNGLRSMVRRMRNEAEAALAQRA